MAAPQHSLPLPLQSENAMSSSTILVTGAAGFIGSSVTEALVLRGAGTVRAGVKSLQPHSGLTRLPVHTIHCDVMDRACLMSAMDGVDVVINCVRDDARTATTVEGTRRILECAAASGVSRLIQFSSVAVYGGATGAISEETRPVPPLNEYGAAKLAAEELCRSAAGEKLHVAVIRPSLVYGPYGEEWTARFIRAIASGRLARLGVNCDGEANLIYVRDLGMFAARLATQEIPSYAVYNANGAEIPTFAEYFDLLSRAIGRGPFSPRAVQPALSAIKRQARRAGLYALTKQAAVARSIFPRSDTIAAVVRSVEKVAFERLGDLSADDFTKRRRYVIDRAREIGFVPTTSLQEGIAASAEWAFAQGLVSTRAAPAEGVPPILQLH
jgi:nucleoside-diphosphate-sugar epimerase